MKYMDAFLYNQAVHKQFAKSQFEIARKKIHSFLATLFIPLRQQHEKVGLRLSKRLLTNSQLQQRPLGLYFNGIGMVKPDTAWASLL